LSTITSHTGQQIALYAEHREQQKVGQAGQCWDLAEEALRAARARLSEDFGAITPDADYVWGVPIPLTEVQPGDILQFRNHVTTTTITTFDSDGRVIGRSWAEALRQHHTAIAADRMHNGQIVVYEQNFDNHPYVEQHAVPLFASTTRVNRPDNQAVSEVIESAVTGTIHAYRPELK
jgi:hypothetical protein